ncbi:hypothetical protein FR762_23800 (plasmid) [Enterobacter sp. E76]|nr:hypothetical protein FR762_23800 [Enterobacter sp. E76]
MVEMPGSELQISKIVSLLSQEHGSIYFRKTQDIYGNDLFVLLNSKGEEVAEWNGNQWLLTPYPRSTGNTLNSTDITSLGSRIEEQILNMGMCQGRLSHLPRQNVKKKKVRRRP